MHTANIGAKNVDGLALELAVAIVPRQATARIVVKRSVRHNGVPYLIEHESPRVLHPALMHRPRKILTALIAAEDLISFFADTSPSWQVQRLTSNRKHEWSVSVYGD